MLLGAGVPHSLQHNAMLMLQQRGKAYKRSGLPSAAERDSLAAMLTAFVAPVNVRQQGTRKPATWWGSMCNRSSLLLATEHHTTTALCHSAAQTSSHEHQPERWRPPADEPHGYGLQSSLAVGSAFMGLTGAHPATPEFRCRPSCLASQTCHTPRITHISTPANDPAR